MKTFYKKALIVGIAAILLEIVIVYFLHNRINAFYGDLTNKIAFLLMEQVKNVIKADKIDLSRLSQYNKYPTRKILNRFSGEDSRILHILLIDTTNTIIVSDDPSVEGKKYRTPQELNLLKTDQPTITSRKWEGDQEILDVVYPLMQDSIKQGYLRTVISVKHLENFYQNRRIILIMASLLSFAIILAAVFTTSQIYRGNIKNIETAIQKLHESDFQFRLKFQQRDEFASVFTRLNELFDKTTDLNASFKKSEEKIQALMRVIHEGLLLVDEELRILSYNDYLLEIFQISDKREAEAQIYQILQRNPSILQIYRQIREGDISAVKQTVSLILLNEASVTLEVNALAISEPNSKSVIFYLKNTEVLEELEENLHRSMRFTVISQLASSIGHEIRNPLSSLAIHTEVLNSLTAQVELQPEMKEKFSKSINILNSEIERLTKLIDSFFNLAKPRPVTLMEEDINQVLQEVLDLVQQQAYEKAVKIHTRLAPDLPEVRISKDQIKQVILNIILNAFDAMPGGGSVFLATGRKNNRVAIAIQDTGPGIPEEIQDKIFDLYFSTKSNGGGIGLAISKKIVEAHEGKIYFKTMPGKGTRFIIELPVS